MDGVSSWVETDLVLIAIQARARGDWEAEREALDALAVLERQ